MAWRTRVTKVGGQILSLLLTLVAVPVAYDLFDQAAYAIARWRNKKHADRGEQDLERFLVAESGGAPPEPVAAEE